MPEEHLVVTDSEWIIVVKYIYAEINPHLKGKKA